MKKPKQYKLKGNSSIKKRRTKFSNLKTIGKYKVHHNKNHLK